MGNLADIRLWDRAVGGRSNPETPAINSAQYSFDHRLHIDPQRSMAYGMNQNPVMVQGELQYMGNYATYHQNLGVDMTPDNCRGQTPRPRSTPKSNTEHNFGNVYSDENFDKQRKPSGSQKTSVVCNEQQMNYRYPDNRPTNYVVNEQVTPCYGTKVGTNMPQESINVAHSSSASATYDHQPIQSKEESLQRSMEWKQGMFQTPLVGMNLIQSSSNTNSSLNLPIRTCETGYSKPLYQPDIRSTPYEPVIRNASNWNMPPPPTSYATVTQSPVSLISSPQKNGRTKILMDLSDSHNHVTRPEPTSRHIYNQNAPPIDLTNLLACHYSPHMHSFTAIPNVNSSENGQRSGCEMDSGSVKKKKAAPRKKPGPKKPKQPKQPRAKKACAKNNNISYIESAERRNSIRTAETSKMASEDDEKSSECATSGAKMDEYKLIELIRARPAIYDVNHSNHNKRGHVEGLWNEIATELNVSVHEIRNKWHILRCSFNRVLREMETSRRQSSKPWPYYESMYFIKDFMRSRKKKRPTSTEYSEQDEALESITETDASGVASTTPTKHHLLIYEDGTTELVSAAKRHKVGNRPEPTPEDPITLFLRSLQTDVSKLAPHKLRQFKTFVMTKLMTLLDEQETETVAQNINNGTYGAAYVLEARTVAIEAQPPSST